LFAYKHDDSVYVKPVEIDTRLMTNQDYPLVGIKADEITPICAISADSTVHAWFLIDDDHVYDLKIRLSDRKATFSLWQKLGKKEKLLTGYAQNGAAYLVFRHVDSKSEGVITVYRNPGLAGSEKHVFPVHNWNRLLDRRFDAFTMDPGVEYGPDLIKWDDKVFHREGYIYFISGFKPGCPTQATTERKVMYSTFSAIPSTGWQMPGFC
jgi:hypothetical protein